MELKNKLIEQFSSKILINVKKCIKNCVFGHGNGKSHGHMMNIPKFPQGRNGQVLKVSDRE